MYAELRSVAEDLSTTDTPLRASLLELELEPEPGPELVPAGPRVWAAAIWILDSRAVLLPMAPGCLGGTGRVNDDDEEI